jgi:hypothetical protein
MAIYEIPLTPAPQTFAIALGGVDYRLTLRWSHVSACWLLDIADSAGAPLIQGIPVLTGTNLLGQYPHLGIGGELWARTDGDPDAVPTFDNLGVSGRLYFVTEPA